MRHELKTIPPHFEDVWREKKRFELRKNDRGFKAGDELYLREYIPSGGYTGRAMLVKVRFILEGFPGLEPDYCIMDISSPRYIEETEKAREDNASRKP